MQTLRSYFTEITKWCDQMAKKKYDVDDPETWSDAQMNKYIVDSVKEIGIALPWKEIALATLFTYGHWKAYGSGPLPTKEDIILGMFYALTVPSALQGGILANSYAIGALGVLGAGLILHKDSDLEAVKDILSDIASAPETLTDKLGEIYKLLTFQQPEP